MYSTDVEQGNSPKAPEPETESRKILEKYKNKSLPAGVGLLLLFAIVVTIIVTGLSERKFKFQVDSMEARLAASNMLDYYMAPSSSSSEPSFDLDVNVTFSVINVKQPIVFGSLLVLLVHDKSVLSSKMADKFYQGSPGQLKVEMKDVRIFSSMEDDNFWWSSTAPEFTLTVKVVGHCWSLAEEDKKIQVFGEGQSWPPLIQGDKEINKSDLQITCKGIKIGLPSSSNDVTTGGGSLPCSKTISMN